MTKAKVTYDARHDTLYARPVERAYASSTEIGPFIIDLDEQGTLVGIEIQSATKIYDITKAVLRKTDDLHINVNITNGTLSVELKTPNQTYSYTERQRSIAPATLALAA